MNLSIEQRQLLSKKATELADSIEAGTYKGPTPTNKQGWCGCAAGLLMEAAGMPVQSHNRWFSQLGGYLEDLAAGEELQGVSLTELTTEIAHGTSIGILVEPYRRIASRLLEAP